MKFILGTKKQMSQIFDEEGRAIPGTLIRTGSLVVTQIKTEKKDGYNAIQVGFGRKRAKNVSKAVIGHAGKAGVLSEKEAFEFIREFRVDESALKDVKIGDIIDASCFAVGDMVTVSGTSKGKGFQGVVKRHNFKGGPRTHGQKHSEREPGSIGAGGVQKVFKGTRMAGRMGTDRITVRNLKIAQVNVEAGEIFIKGALPGRPGSLLEVTGK